MLGIRVAHSCRFLFLFPPCGQEKISRHGLFRNLMALENCLQLILELLSFVPTALELYSVYRCSDDHIQISN